jgi:hypothetical protein
MLKKFTVQILMFTTVLLFSEFNLFAQGETPIVFRKGKSSATVNGTLAAGEARTYVLTAKRGQRLTATVSSPDGKVVFCRSEINPTGNKTERYTTVAGKNYLCIENTRTRGRAGSFKLTVSIR